MHTPGDIQSLTKWLTPDIVVITALPDVPVHVENFSDPSEVAREKKALAEALREGGTLLLGGDDKRTVALKDSFSHARVLLFGVEAHNDISASNISVTYSDEGRPTGMQFHLEAHGVSMPMRVQGRLGQQQIYPTLATFAVAQVLELNLLTVTKALESEHGPRGRMKILTGYNGSTILDDSYNSSPTALRAALIALKKIETKGRKIVVLGDMLELGRFSADAHTKAGVQAASIADVIITLGLRAKGIAQAAREAGFSAENIQEFNSGEAQDAGRMLRSQLAPGDVVLVKGSQSGIRLEKTIKEMLEEPQQARNLLVRQEDEWMVR